MLSDLFYTVTFTVSIVASTITIFLGLAIIVAVIIHHPCRTVRNLLLCNTAAATCIYSLFQITLAVYGFRADPLHPPPACVFQAYFYTAVCVMVPVSYLLQSISSYFFAVLYRHKYLLGWKIHWLMIVANYFYAFVGSLTPIFHDRGYEFEAESRLCLATTKVLRVSMYTVSIAYLIPLNLIILLYGIIFYETRQAARRVTAFAPDRLSHGRTITSNTVRPNLQREMKLMKNILILVSILLLAGIPYLMMVIWQAATTYPPPEPMYSLCMVDITVFFVIKMIVLFYMNREVKNTVVTYLRKMCFL
jgi:7 transmembrane receptor (rhodopsin family)